MADSDGSDHEDLEVESLVQLEILPESDTTVPDDATDIFSQDEPDALHTIKIKYINKRNHGSVVRVFDVEQLNVWIERQAKNPHDPIVPSVTYSNDQQREIARRAAQVFCGRLGLNPTDQAGNLFIAIRLMPDAELVVLLKDVDARFWTQDNLFTLVEEAVQRRRAVALSFLYELGRTRFKFNIATLTTMVLLAMEKGWPTRELVRLISKRIAAEKPYAWSRAVIILLSAAIQNIRYDDVSRIIRRLLKFADPVHLRQMRASMSGAIEKDAIFQILFRQYDFRSRYV